VKAVAAVIGGFVLLVFGAFGVGNTVLTSVPFASDQQRAFYDEAVQEYWLKIPGSVLLAVDTVRFHQDFSQVDRATVRQTAELFAACVDFRPMNIPSHGKSQRIPFHVPRSGTVRYGIDDASPGVTGRVVDGEGQSYPTRSVLAAGDYWLEVEAPSDSSRYRLRLYMDLEPCGEEEISAVLDRLGLVGDDRAMVYHLIALYLPEEMTFGRVAPGPYTWPLKENYPVTSLFGPRLDPVTGTWGVHTGVDLGAPEDTPVWTATDGLVSFTGWDGGYGNAVRISHGDGVTTVYGHLKTILVTAGQVVTNGQTVGLVGSTGKSTGPHLHFEWRVNGEPVDPLGVYHWTPNETP